MTLSVVGLVGRLGEVPATEEVEGSDLEAEFLHLGCQNGVFGIDLPGLHFVFGV